MSRSRSSQATPSFDEWVDYCFTQGYADFNGTCEDAGGDNQAQREARFHGMKPSTIASYLIRLFESPSFVIDRYRDDQIAEATWFIFGTASEYLHAARSDEVEPESQVRCIRSLTTLYSDLYDRVCGCRGTDCDTDLRFSAAIDGAVYMIWDMDCLEGAILFPKKGAILVEPCLQVLETVLRKCRSSACRISALHAMGHIGGHYLFRDEKHWIAQRLQRAIDAFLQRKDVPAWVRDYAMSAREGVVQ